MPRGYRPQCWHYPVRPVCAVERLRLQLWRKAAKSTIKIKIKTKTTILNRANLQINGAAKNRPHCPQSNGCMRHARRGMAASPWHPAPASGCFPSLHLPSFVQFCCRQIIVTISATAIPHALERQWQNKRGQFVTWHVRGPFFTHSSIYSTDMLFLPDHALTLPQCRPRRKEKRRSRVCSSVRFLLTRGPPPESSSASPTDTHTRPPSLAHSRSHTPSRTLAHTLSHTHTR